MKSKILSLFLAVTMLMSGSSLTFTVSAEEQENISQIRESETYLIHRDSPEEIEQKKEQMKENLLAKVEADPDGYQE